MACFEKNSFSKTWILTRYSKLTRQKTWDTLNSCDCDEALTLSITSTNCLLISSGSDVCVRQEHNNGIVCLKLLLCFAWKLKEYINLWTGKESFSGVFKGNSMLVTHQLKDLSRKFRVQFLDSGNKSGEENCEACMFELRRFINFKPYKLDKSNCSDPNSLMDSNLMDSAATGVSANGNGTENSRGKMKSVSLKELAQVGWYFFLWNIRLFLNIFFVGVNW